MSVSLFSEGVADPPPKIKTRVFVLFRAKKKVWAGPGPPSQSLALLWRVMLSVVSRLMVDLGIGQVPLKYLPILKAATAHVLRAGSGGDSEGKG